MNKTLVYFIGVPGAGKTTLLRELLGRHTLAAHDKPVPHSLLAVPAIDGPAVWLGKDRDKFGGTDAMAMSIQPEVLAWMKGKVAGHQVPRLVVGEGDRLANDSFFGEMTLVAGFTLLLFELHVPAAVAVERRAERGSDQNEKWIKGRETKVVKLAEAYHAIRLDGTDLPTQLATQVEADLKARDIRFL